jgi:glycosyltransferase involved in cell wall biosynthesis
VFGMADILNRYADGAAASMLPSTADMANLRPGIGIYGLFTAETGIGQSARRSAKSLRAAGVPVSLHNITMPKSFENRIDFDVGEDLVSPYDTALIHLNPDSLLHELRRGPIEAFVGRRRIGFWHWELPVFPAPWAKAFEKVHEVWAPSSFVARAVSAASDLPVRIVHHAVHGDEIPQDFARESLGLPADEYFFLSIFDLNSYPVRKNPVGIVRAFLDAFPRAGPSSPRLIVKCHGKGNRNAAFDELLRCIHKDARVLLFDEVFSTERIQLLQAACDCYVSLHRSEGFGLNILESMVLGKPCIATGFSGNMDFMTSRNSIIIPFGMRRVEKDEYPHAEGQWWAEPDHDTSVDALRRAGRKTSRHWLGKRATTRSRTTPSNGLGS